MSNIYPKNFRFLVTSEIVRAKRACAEDIASCLFMLNDNEAFYFLMGYYPHETRKALGLPPQLELIKGGRR